MPSTFVQGGPVLVSAEDLNWDLTREFDEARCRDYIERVGAKVVPCYSFSLGMEEVYACLHIRYGNEGLSDAISVFHEILDEPSNSHVGLPDEIFQVWKQPWRLRNVSSRLHHMTITDIFLEPNS